MSIDSSCSVLSCSVLNRWQERFRNRDWMVQLEATTENALAKRSAADTFQIRSIAKQRLVRKLGTLSQKEMKNIIDALHTILN
ncbi:growth inhibitor [Xenococcus sp. PCC 7305]|uniref:type II toxin-antitoxin system PemK/MazF family toxin n=1 Tax=Xenococcus sp. PCC 7305 TaxID=102125 RepID=UPI0002ABB8BB|nr:type II toxin-antitoxin system PemK/MazF family toxin [Xenococcus sp. PCC 7305]ELS00393.1 growth inhibitor [Xenococcus sp. PCC 7305]